MRLRLGKPLLAAPARRWVGALAVGSAGLVAVLGVIFAHQDRADPLDRAIDDVVLGWFGGHSDVAFRLASPGSLGPAAWLGAAIVIACLLAGRLNGALLVLAVPVAVGLVEGVFKPLFGRTYLGALTYPSGHSTAVFALAGTVTLLLEPQRPGRARAVRVAVTVAAWVLGCIVATAVIGLKWHYFTDTVAGAAVGVGTVCGLALALDRPTVRSWLARGPVTADRAA